MSTALQLAQSLAGRSQSRLPVVPYVTVFASANRGDSTVLFSGVKSAVGYGGNYNGVLSAVQSEKAHEIKKLSNRVSSLRYVPTHEGLQPNGEMEYDNTQIGS